MTEVNLENTFAEMDRLQERLEEVFYYAMEEYAGTVSDRLADELSVPFPPASQPGEKPHKRTGKLQGGIHHVTDQDGQSITSVIISERPGGEPGVPGRLNFGMNRPYMTDTYNVLLSEFPVEIRNIIRQRI